MARHSLAALRHPKGPDKGTNKDSHQLLWVPAPLATSVSTSVNWDYDPLLVLTSASRFPRILQHAIYSKSWDPTQKPLPAGCRGPHAWQGLGTGGSRGASLPLLLAERLGKARRCVYHPLPRSCREETRLNLTTGSGACWQLV